MTGDRLREPADMDMLARETWWSLCRMSYTGDQPDLRKQDIEEIASLIRDLAALARSNADRDMLLADAIDALERMSYWDITVEKMRCPLCDVDEGEHEDGCEIGELLARFRALGDHT